VHLDPVLIFSVVVGLPLCFSMLIATIVLHFSMPDPLKKRFVTERYFNGFELGLEFPASMFRTLALVRAVAAPRSMRKRFGDHDVRASVGSGFVVVCQVYVVLVGLTAVFLLLMAMGGIVVVVSGESGGF